MQYPGVISKFSTFEDSTNTPITGGRGCEGKAEQELGAWDISGVCDVPAMTDAINAHLRPRSTTHTTARIYCQNTDRIVRRTFSNPADIPFPPAKSG